MNPKLYSKPRRREILIAIISTVQFLFGILMVTQVRSLRSYCLHSRSFVSTFFVFFYQGGVYIFNMYDNYAAAGWCLFFIGICESLTVSWLYKWERFWSHVCHMLRFEPKIPYFKYAWAFITPTMTMVSDTFA